MRRYTEVIKKGNEPIAIICNRCGKEIHKKNGVWTEDILHVEKAWGYFSEKDTRRDSFDLCETCYDEITGTFAIPVEVEEL